MTEQKFPELIEKSREQLYICITDNFTEREKQVIKNLFGRNSEIGYLFLKASKFLGVELVEDIAQVMQQKQDEEEISDSYYFGIE